MNRQIKILDTTLTDGFNSAGIFLLAEDKLAVAHQLAQVGVDIIEAGYPSRSAADFAAVEAISRQISTCKIAARSRILISEIDRAALAIRNAPQPRIKLTAPASPRFIRQTLRMDEREFTQAVVAAVRRAKSHVADVQFTVEDATRTDWKFLAEVCSAAAAAGASTVVIQDSLGQLTPKEFYDIIRHLRDYAQGLDQVDFGVDCRHELGLALGNALGAVERGVEQVECSVGGIGYPLGHVPLEAFVTALRSRPDRYRSNTSIRSESLYMLSDIVQALTGAEGVLWGRVLRDVAISQAEMALPTGPDPPLGSLVLNSFRISIDQCGDCFAEVILTDGVRELRGEATGANQIETLHRAISQALSCTNTVVDHVVHHHRRDCKEVTVCLESGPNVVTGRGVASTVLKASAQAYLDALRSLEFSSETQLTIT